MASMDSKLCGTTVTGTKIVSVLSKCADIDTNHHQIHSVTAEVIGEGQGFTSKVLRVHLTWSPDSNGVALRSIVLKTPTGDAITDVIQAVHTLSDDSEELYDSAPLIRQICKAHNDECSVYELQELNRVVPMPRTYGMLRHDELEAGILILEDLSDKGVVLPMSPRPFSDAQLDQVLDALTNVHAWSLNTRVDWRRTIPKLSERYDIWATFISSTSRLFNAIKKMLPDQFKDMDVDRMSKYVSAENYVEIFGCEKHTDKVPSVMVHGDVHIMNMMFEKRQDGTGGDKLVALYDWQLTHQGCGLEDLCRLYIMGISTKKRREEGDDILRQYIELFNRKVNNVQHRIRYEDAKKFFDQMFAFMALLMSGMVILADTFLAKTMAHLSEQEKADMKKEFIDDAIARYEDALKILKW